MKKNELVEFKKAVTAGMRRLRLERHWTQAAFAGILGLSQSRFSEVERGQGSFTAEQLLIVLRNFNVQLDYFLPLKPGGVSQIQNALARLGAAHMLENSDSVPSERFKEAAAVIVETLISPRSPRLLTALAPVVVWNIDVINFNKLRFQLAEAGFESRLGWLLDNTLAAVRYELPAVSGEWRSAYRRTELVLGNLLESWQAVGVRENFRGLDIIDRDILSGRTLEEVRADSTPLSRKWGIITRLVVDDFVVALRGADENR